MIAAGIANADCSKTRISVPALLRIAVGREGVIGESGDTER